jgi:type IV pilus assembly protein PilW
MKRITGFSLVELLTALAISTLIVLGIGQAFISQKVSYQAQNGLSRVQQTGRFVVEYIGNDIRRAGFPGIVEESSAFFNAIIPALSADGGGNVSDTLTLMYRTTTDCLGVATPVYTDGEQYAKNRYSIVGGNLVCTTFDEADTQISSDVLARGVQNMQILYGINNQFVSASSLATADWANVTGIRAAFLVNSVDNTTDFTDTNTYALLNADALGPFNDTQRRRVFTTTSTMRNRLDRT